MLIITAIVNFLVGVCIGLTGIAGFLLPMFYTGFIRMPATEALALSFTAFLVSGILGSVSYYKNGKLEVKESLVLSAGSLAGAAGGVSINLLIPEEIIKMILYLVVLLSGISILLRKDSEKSSGKQKYAGKARWIGYLVLGAVTGAVCAASGAGGPVLVMPLLTLMGFPPHTAVGMALFNSVFIAVPAAAGYLMNADAVKHILMMLAVIIVSHGAGVVIGSRNAVKINQTLLKRIVAAGSIGIACIKLLF